MPSTPSPAFLSPPHHVRHLLLDLDGTLIHSGNFLVHVEFIGRILPLMKKHRGWRAAWKALKEGRDSLKIPSKDKTNHDRFVAIFQKHLRISRVQAESSLFEALLLVFPRLEPHFGEIEGAAHFVDWAKERYPLTLATNPVWPRALVEMRMRWGGIDPENFESMTTSDRMHACKPTLEYFRELLTQEKLDPYQCILIGNETKMDLPAIKAGISVFLIRPSKKQMKCLVKPVHHPDGTYTAGAWQGNYRHLRHFLEEHSNAVKEKII